MRRDYIYTMDFSPSAFHQLELVGPAWLNDIQDWESNCEGFRFHVGRVIDGRYFVLVLPLRIVGEDGFKRSTEPATVYWFRRFVHAEAKFRALIDEIAPALEDDYASLGLDNPATEMQAELESLS